MLVHNAKQGDDIKLTAQQIELLTANAQQLMKKIE